MPINNYPFRKSIIVKPLFLLLLLFVVSGCSKGYSEQDLINSYESGYQDGQASMEKDSLALLQEQVKENKLSEIPDLEAKIEELEDLISLYEQYIVFIDEYDELYYHKINCEYIDPSSCLRVDPDDASYCGMAPCTSCYSIYEQEAWYQLKNAGFFDY